MKIFVRNFVAVIILASLALQPLGVLAFSITTVPVSDSALGQGDIAGEIANTAANAAYTAADGINTGCEKTEEAYFLSEQPTEVALAGLSMIGGSAVETVHLDAKVATLTGFIECRQRALDAAKAIVAINSYGANKKQLLENKVSAAIDILNKKKSDLMSQSRVAKKGFWKSLVLSVLLKTTKTIAKKLANQLTSTYKINDFQRYTDVVGSQVYATQLIQKTATDKNDQLMLRSLIENPIAQNEISPAVKQLADQSLGMDLKNYDVKNTSFYADMAKVGAGPNNAFTLNLIKADRAATIAAKGRSDATQEVQQSVGLKAPRSCKGDINQQKNIDRDYQLAQKKYEDRLKLYNDLQNAQDTVTGLSDQQAQQLASDLAKAKSDVDKAASELNKLPQSFSAPVLTICDSIVSPATAIDKGIDKGFGFFGDNIAQYNNEHLPFFTNFVSSLVSDISSSLIFGGSADKAILRETGTLSTAIGTAIGSSSNNSTDLSSGIVFDFEKSSNAADAYTLTWDAQGVQNASYVTIAGTGISGATKMPLSGSAEIHTSISGTYLLKVFDKSNKQLSTSSLDLQVQAPDTASGSGLQGPMVFGASIRSQPVYIRGQ